MLLAVCLLFAGCGADDNGTSAVSFGTTASGEETPEGTADPADTTASDTLPEDTAAETPAVSAEDTTAPEDMTGEPSSSSDGSLVVIDPTDPNATDTVTEATTPEETSAGEPESTEATTAPDPDKKYVALSFDDGPDMRYTSSTSRILDTLEKYGAKATFFVLATQLDYNGVADETTGETFAERNAKLVKRAYDMGMEIGSHTYNHKDLNTLSTEEIQKELGDACAKTEAITGGKVQIMRPPYGNANEKVRNAIDMPMIIWDVDSLDWQSKDPDKIYDEVMTHVKPGSVILMHDIYNTTADGVEKVVPALIDKGYTIVTVSELYQIYGKTLEPHKVYMSAWYDE